MRRGRATGRGGREGEIIAKGTREGKELEEGKGSRGGIRGGEARARSQSGAARGEGMRQETAGSRRWSRPVTMIGTRLMRPSPCQSSPRLMKLGSSQMFISVPTTIWLFTVHCSRGAGGNGSE